MAEKSGVGEKNLKPVGEAPPAPFLSGEKELGFRVFEFFSECVKNAPPPS